MASLIERLIERFSEVLEAHTARLPSAIPYAVPVRTLAETAVDVLALGHGVPMIPVYEAELAAQRTWYGIRSAAQLEEGLSFPQISAVLAPDHQVLIAATGADGQTAVVPLPPNDAEEFALQVLSTVDAARQSDLTNRENSVTLEERSS